MMSRHEDAALDELAENDIIMVRVARQVDGYEQLQPLPLPLPLPLPEPVPEPEPEPEP